MSGAQVAGFAILTGLALGALSGIRNALWAIKDELSAMRREAREARFAPRPR